MTFRWSRWVRSNRRIINIVTPTWRQFVKSSQADSRWKQSRSGCGKQRQIQSRRSKSQRSAPHPSRTVLLLTALFRQLIWPRVILMQDSQARTISLSSIHTINLRSKSVRNTGPASKMEARKQIRLAVRSGSHGAATRLNCHPKRDG